jgi:Fe-Mn family superoxide dismutase
VNRNTDKLEIVSTGNQENPLMTTTSFAGTPLLYPFLGLDVWEHSYYLKYLGARKQYVKAWFKVINWSQVSRYYEVFSINGLAVEWWR